MLPNERQIERVEFKFRHFVLITIFAIFFAFTVTDGIRTVIQKIYNLPSDAFSFGYWEGTFWTRIIASIFGYLAGGFVIGTYLGNAGKIPAVLHTVPSVILWLSVLIVKITNFNEYSFPSLALILVILDPLSGIYGWQWGCRYMDEFENGKRILNIKWYHWFWILLLYLDKVISIPLFFLIILWKIDLTYNNYIANPIFTLIFNPGYIVSRIIILIFLSIIVCSINHCYSLLSEENTVKVWKKGIFIFCHVAFLMLIYIFLFGIQQLYDK